MLTTNFQKDNMVLKVFWAISKLYAPNKMTRWSRRPTLQCPRRAFWTIWQDGLENLLGNIKNVLWPLGKKKKMALNSFWPVSKLYCTQNPDKMRRRFRDFLGTVPTVFWRLPAGWHDGLWEPLDNVECTATLQVICIYVREVLWVQYIIY
jgi:hypothetical protein